MRAANDEFTDSLYDFFPAQITAVAAGTGAQAGMNLYAWREQEYDITTGKFRDAVPGRSGTTSSAYALEVNNQIVSPLPAYVMMRCMGAVQGNLTYLFQSPTTATGLVTASAYGSSGYTTVPGDGTVTLIDCSTALIANLGPRTVLTAQRDGTLGLPSADGIYQLSVYANIITNTYSGSSNACGWLILGNPYLTITPIAVMPLNLPLPPASSSLGHLLNAAYNAELNVPGSLGIYAAQTLGAGVNASVSVAFTASYIGQ